MWVLEIEWSINSNIPVLSRKISLTGTLSPWMRVCDSAEFWQSNQPTCITNDQTLFFLVAVRPESFRSFLRSNISNIEFRSPHLHKRLHSTMSTCGVVILVANNQSILHMCQYWFLCNLFRVLTHNLIRPSQEAVITLDYKVPRR